MSWGSVPLKEIAPSKPLKHPQVSDNQNIWLLNLDKVESHSGTVIQKVRGDINTAGSSTHWFDDSHVLYSKLRPYLNKVVLPDEEGLATTELVPLMPDKERLDRRYLAYYLRSQNFVNWVTEKIAGAKMPRVSMDVFWKHEIPVPFIDNNRKSLEEQKRIAAILDKADAIRRKRRQAIQLADDFLRSVFLDMFGDPVSNPKGFPISLLSDFYVDCKSGTKCGPFGSALKKHEYTEEGVPVWNMDNISLSGEFKDSPRLWITESKYLDLEAYSVIDGDVIISRAGTVGKMGVVRSKSKRSIISTNLIRVRFGEKLRPEYFINLMYYCKGRIGRLKTGPDGAFTHMNTGILDKLELPYPSVELQDKFIAIKSKLLSSLAKSEQNELDKMFNSLSQKAFASEL